MGKLFRQQLKPKKDWTSRENRLYEEKGHHIYLRFSYFDENSEKWKYPEIKTGEKLPATQFNNSKGEVSGRSDECIKVKDRLLEIEKQYNSLLRDYKKQNLPITKDFGDKVISKALFISEGKKRLDEEEKQVGTLSAFMEKRFIPEMGKIKHKHNGTTKLGFAPNRQRNLKSICEKYIYFTKKTGNNPFLALINADDLQSYENWLRDTQLHAEGTISTDMKAICSIINHAKNHFKVPVNRDYKEGYTIPTAPRKKTSDIFTLTREEIKSISSLDLPKQGVKGEIHYLENARQLFLLQYYTALRVSDLVEVEVIEVFEAKGRKLANLYNRKTESEITIPIADKIILEVLERKEFHIIADTNLNDYYKELGKRAGIEKQMNHYLLQPKEKPDGTMVWRKLPYKGARFEFIQTHTLRRTRLTILQKQGWSEEMLMGISGHKKAEQLYSYIGENRTQKEIAVRNYDALVDAGL